MSFTGRRRAHQAAIANNNFVTPTHANPVLLGALMDPRRHKKTKTKERVFGFSALFSFICPSPPCCIYTRMIILLLGGEWTIHQWSHPPMTSRREKGQSKWSPWSDRRKSQREVADYAIWRVWMKNRCNNDNAHCVLIGLAIGEQKKVLLFPAIFCKLIGRPGDHGERAFTVACYLVVK